MKKSILTFISLIALIFMVNLSACSILPKYSDPESMEIQEQKYVTGFYDNL